MGKLVKDMEINTKRMQIQREYKENVQVTVNLRDICSSDFCGPGAVNG